MNETEHNPKAPALSEVEGSRSLMPMSERDARGPEDDDKPSFILGGSVSSPVENRSGAVPAE